MQPVPQNKFYFPATNRNTIFGQTRRYSCVRCIQIWKSSETTKNTCVFVVLDVVLCKDLPKFKERCFFTFRSCSGHQLAGIVVRAMASKVMNRTNDWFQTHWLSAFIFCLFDSSHAGCMQNVKWMSCCYACAACMDQLWSVVSSLNKSLNCLDL